MGRNGGGVGGNGAARRAGAGMGGRDGIVVMMLHRIRVVWEAVRVRGETVTRGSYSMSEERGMNKKDEE